MVMLRFHNTPPLIWFLLQMDPYLLFCLGLFGECIHSCGAVLAGASLRHFIFGFLFFSFCFCKLHSVLARAASVIFVFPKQMNSESNELHPWQDLSHEPSIFQIYHNYCSIYGWLRTPLAWFACIWCALAGWCWISYGICVIFCVRCAHFNERQPIFHSTAGHISQHICVSIYRLIYQMFYTWRCCFFVVVASSLPISLSLSRSRFLSLSLSLFCFLQKKKNWNGWSVHKITDIPACTTYILSNPICVEKEITQRVVCSSIHTRTDREKKWSVSVVFFFHFREKKGKKNICINEDLKINNMGDV